MNNSFTSVSLGEFLTPVSRQEDVIPEKVYPILGSHWYAKGLYVKDVKPGSEIQADKIYRVEKGDFVYNRLFAWKGSFAIALEENNNCYVSNEFPCFEVNQARVDSHYLWQYFSQSSIWNDALGLSSGGTPTSRNRLKEEKLLSMKIPLPPLEEQQRIVARIEELATRIEEARGLRREAVEETEALVNVAARNLLAFTNIEPTELRCWTALDRDGIQTGPFGAQLGSQDFESTGVPVLTIGNIQYYGLELNSLKYVSEEKAQELSRFSIKEGDIIFARMGTVGRCCVVPPKAEGWLFNISFELLWIRQE